LIEINIDIACRSVKSGASNRENRTLTDIDTMQAKLRNAESVFLDSAFSSGGQGKQFP
jgi:hypothetical protein